MKKFLSFVLCVALCLSFIGCKSENMNEKVNVYGIKGPTGIGLANMMENDGYNFKIVGSPDEIVGKITTGEVDIAAVPTNLAAKLFKKTKGDVLMLAANTIGGLSFVEHGNTVKSISDLKGKTILTSGQGANPEYILNYLLKENGIDAKKQVTIKYFDDNDTLMAQILRSDEGTVALIAQPATATLLMRADKMGVDINKVIDVNDEWNKKAPKDSLVMGCMVVRKEFAKKNPAKLKKFMEEYEASIGKANSDLEATVENCVKHEIIINERVARDAIPQCNIVFIAGDKLRKTVEPFYKILLDFNADSIGGSLPGAKFYYDK